MGQGRTNIIGDSTSTMAAMSETLAYSQVDRSFGDTKKIITNIDRRVTNILKDNVCRVKFVNMDCPNLSVN